MTEQNTLAQIIIDDEHKLTFKPQCSNDIPFIYRCVKVWLQQFREQPLVRNTKTTNEAELNYTAGQLKMLRTLMETLDK